MKHLTIPAALAVALTATQAVAQSDSYPSFEVEAPPYAMGGYVAFRIVAKVSGGEHTVVGGAFNIDYEITCQSGPCGITEKRVVRSWTVIPCGSSETGPLAVRLDQLPKGGLRKQPRIKLKITNIEYDDYGDEGVDEINRRHGFDTRRYNPDGTYEMERFDPCSKKGDNYGSGNPKDSVGDFASLTVTLD